jgi:CBS domain-containing protein
VPASKGGLRDRNDLSRERRDDVTELSEFGDTSTRCTEGDRRRERKNIMQVKELMTAEPACCTQHSNLVDVARLMRDHDCGALPVVEDSAIGEKLVGIVTDRDIVLRAVAEGSDPAEMTAGQCMSMIVATVSADASLEECARIMEEHKVRRVPVVDEQGNCCGIVAQADLARNATLRDIGEVVREVSQPAESIA